MKLDELQEWILAISGSVTLLSVAISACVAVAQYRLKARAEVRLVNSSRAETDLRLLKMFTELMDLAMGRRTHVLSEKTIEELFRIGVLTKEDFEDPFSANRRIADSSVVALPVGKSGQEAAIAAIATLATRYDVLRDAAIQGLEGIMTHSPKVAGKHLRRIEQPDWAKEGAEKYSAPNPAPATDG